MSDWFYIQVVDLSKWDICPTACWFIGVESILKVGAGFQTVLKNPKSCQARKNEIKIKHFRQYSKLNPIPGGGGGVNHGALLKFKSKSSFRLLLRRLFLGGIKRLAVRFKIYIYNSLWLCLSYQKSGGKVSPPLPPVPTPMYPTFSFIRLGK